MTKDKQRSKGKSNNLPNLSEYTDVITDALEKQEVQGSKIMKNIIAEHNLNDKKKNTTLEQSIVPKQEIKKGPDHVNEVDEQKNIINLFNKKYLDGIEEIKEIANKQGIEPEKIIAEFLFYESDKINDKTLVSHYLGARGESTDEHKKVLGHFTKMLTEACRGKTFVESLRIFLEKVAIMQDVTKTANLFDCFTKSYVEANPLKADRIIQSLNNKVLQGSTSQELQLEKLKYLIQEALVFDLTITKERFIGKIDRAVRPYEEKKSENIMVNPEFLSGMYEELKANPLAPIIGKIEPKYAFTPQAENQKNIFEYLNAFLSTNNKNDFDKAFPNLAKEELIVSVDKSKGWLNRLTGYRGTIRIEQKENSTINKKDSLLLTSLVNIEIYEPNLVSRVLFGTKSIVEIAPFEISEAKKLDLISWAKTAEGYKNVYYNDTTKSNAEKENWQNVAKVAQTKLNNENLRFNKANKIANIISSAFNNKKSSFVDKLHGQSNQRRRRRFG